MDPGVDWTASALFSPSKARAQQAQAKDWAFVEAWLVKKYGHTRLPIFERNEDTLQALLDLATLNEGADERQALAERVERTVLQTISKRQSDQDPKMDALLVSLTSSTEEPLSALAESAVLLNSSDAVTMAGKVLSLTSERFELDQRIGRVQAQQALLNRERARLTELLETLKGDAFAVPSSLPQETAELSRSTKQLKAKVLEYDERLSALKASTNHVVPFELLAQKRADLKAQRQRLSELHAELEGYRALPSDPVAAKAKLEAARNELRRLTGKRDDLFARLIGD